MRFLTILFILLFTSCIKDIRRNEPHVIYIDIVGDVNGRYLPNTWITIYYKQQQNMYMDFDKWLTLDNNSNTIFGGPEKTKFKVDDMKPYDSLIIRVNNKIKEKISITVSDNGKTVYSDISNDKIIFTYTIK